MRVFISSTFEDLAEFREELITALGMDEIDFKAMEFFSSDPFSQNGLSYFNFLP